jgi:release factor glutamine methyltransferase
LLTHVTGFSRVSFFARPEKSLTPEQVVLLSTLLSRRLDGEPIAYITGKKEFWSLSLEVEPGVLVPRPDTEILVEKALSLYTQLPQGCIIELGTGSGAIALALAQEIDDQAIVAVERSAQALRVAASNIKSFGMERVHLIQSSWLDALQSQSAAMIISNPPYLAADDEHLPSLKHEPHNALVSGSTGLEDLQTIIKESRRVCKPGGVLMLEHGYQQGQDVRSILTNYNYLHVQTDRDLAGHERISYGYLGLES